MTQVPALQRPDFQQKRLHPQLKKRVISQDWQIGLDPESRGFAKGSEVRHHGDFSLGVEYPNKVRCTCISHPGTNNRPPANTSNYVQ